MSSTGDVAKRLSGPSALCAYADESIRECDGVAYYLLAASIVRDDRGDSVRGPLCGLLLSRQRWLHWHDEDDFHRRAIAGVVASIRIDSLVVVGTPIDLKRQERARRKVLEQLLWALDQRDVEHLTLGSRQAQQDRLDLTVVGGLRNAKRLSRRLRVDHGNTREEPLLWLADAVVGAVGDDLCGRPDCLAMMRRRVHVMHLDLA